MCNLFKQLTSKPAAKHLEIYIPKPRGMSGAEAFLISGPAPRKKLRVVCVSDTHNSSPKYGIFKVPPGDVLIHAGDMTNQGSYSELKRSAEWIGDCPHEVKLVIAGMFCFGDGCNKQQLNWEPVLTTGFMIRKPRWSNTGSGVSQGVWRRFSQPGAAVLCR